MVLEIYAEWQRRPIQRNCTGIADCCRFKLIGHTPYLTRGEALVAAHAWKAAGRKEVVVPADGSCPFLHPPPASAGSTTAVPSAAAPTSAPRPADRLPEMRCAT